MSSTLITAWTRGARTRSAGGPAGARRPAGACSSRELFEDEPQLAHRQFYPVLDHAVVGRHRVDGMPAKLSRTPAEFRRGGPLMGKTTITFLQALGMPLDEVRRLEEEQICGDGESERAARNASEPGKASGDPG
jgi:crotonobetainyl-CoA:carnitine CoA-transferase CaiB-like acyl-CoA transferase